jgi:hypothetical protein
MGKGDRVRFSPEGIAALSTYLTEKVNKSRRGTVASTPQADKDTVAVIWDGCKTSQRYHRSFIEPEDLQVPA